MAIFLGNANSGDQNFLHMLIYHGDTFYNTFLKKSVLTHLEIKKRTRYLKRNIDRSNTEKYNVKIWIILNLHTFYGFFKLRNLATVQAIIVKRTTCIYFVTFTRKTNFRYFNAVIYCKKIIFGEILHFQQVQLLKNKNVAKRGLNYFWLKLLFFKMQFMVSFGFP